MPMYSRSCASWRSSTTGPMSVPALRASSTFKVFIFSTMAATKRSWMPSVTIKRLLAVQRWPVEKKPLLMAAPTATFRSASSSTTNGFLPPISSCTLAPRGTQAAATRWPVPTEPVKLTPAMRSSSSSTAPTSEPRPITRLNTPAGRPARCRMSASAQAEPGTTSAGLNTTQLPEARAGPIFQAGGAHGRHHLAAGAQRLAGKELEDGRGAADFANGFGQGLAFFAGQQVAQLGLARDDLVAHGVQDVKALLGRGQAPCREGRVRGGDGVERLFAAGHGVVSYHIARVGRVGVLVGANAVSPGAANQVCMHGGGVVVKKRVLRKKGAVAC